jgi:ABC-type transport system involved in cytochrome bd biosynthesis fused ATPase/permease subunit
MQNSGALDMKLKSAIALLQRVVIAFASMAAIILGLYLAYSNGVGSAVTCLTTGIVLFVFSNLDLFESIKAPGVEATMRTIDAKVQEVQALAKKVASTSSVTAEFCMEIMVRIGRFSGPLPRPQAL